MDELSKIYCIVNRKVLDVVVEFLLVLDVIFG